MTDTFIAHLRKKDGKTQSLWDHLLDASMISGQNAEKIGLKEAGEILGLLHDLGKASDEFQKYILSANGLIDPDEDEYVDVTEKKGKIDHSSAGAQFIYRTLCGSGKEGEIAGQVLAICLASHHSGLIDCLSPEGENAFTKRMEKSEDFTHSKETFAHFQKALGVKLTDLLSKKVEKQLVEKMQGLKEYDDLKKPIDTKETITFKYGLLIRYLFSCLIDADRLNTADFEFPNNAEIRNNGQYHPWETLIGRLDVKLQTFNNMVKKNEVDILRDQVSQACLDFSTKPRGIYQLKVPTGGGKTLASLRFALNHAAYHGLDHVFYIVPFTSIIDQNADEARKILEDRDQNGQFLDKVVLEHHSNLTPDEESRRHNLLAQNWDAPIVFTTQVQFLDAFFGYGTRSVRRLHQLANSVIIFDEVQTIPVRCVHMFNLALRFLVHSCGATVVLCTATQPLLDKVEPPSRSLPIKSESQIIQNDKEIFEKLKRIEVLDRRKTGGWTETEVADLAIQQLAEKGDVLIIVNTRDSARLLYQALERKTSAALYHLSTNMCPAHRLKVLAEIKAQLEGHKPVICVSTQLIEAGVDIDFGAVIRYLAGLDSIVQAAGRCNRHGIRSLGNVCVVNPSQEKIDRLKDIKIGIRVTERVWDEYHGDPKAFDYDRLGLQAMHTYYRYYFYERNREMSYPISKQSPAGREDDLFNLLSVNTNSVAEYQRITDSTLQIPFKQSFRTAAKSFKAIDQISRGVVAPYGVEGEQLVNDLCAAQNLEKQFGLLKKAQRYSVNLFPYEFEDMVNKKAIQEVQPGAGIFHLNDQYYCHQFGWCDEIVNEMKTLIY
jgi:CRISPR-associated endonuclease/helicase Cas3